MTRIIARLKNEPAVVYSLVEALLVLAVSFGLDLSAEQVGAIVAVLAVLTGVGTRQQAYGPKTVDGILDAEAVIAAAERGEEPPSVQ